MITTLSFSETIDDGKRITSVLETLSDSIQRAVTATGGSSLKLLRFLQHTDQQRFTLYAFDEETGEAFGTEVNIINDGSEVLSVFINTVEESNNLSTTQGFTHPGIGTFCATNSSGSTVITFHPSVTNDVNVVANIAQLRAASGGTGGSQTLKVAKLNASQTHCIHFQASPTAVGIASFTTPYELII